MGIFLFWKISAKGAYAIALALHIFFAIIVICSNNVIVRIVKTLHPNIQFALHYSIRVNVRYSGRSLVPCVTR